MTSTKPFDVTTRCQHCGGTRKEHHVRKPYRCPTRLKDTFWTPWTVEAYAAAEETGRRAANRLESIQEFLKNEVEQRQGSGLPETDPYIAGSRNVLADAVTVSEFLERIARMQTENETKNGFVSENAIADLTGLIQEARDVTGINPMHPQVYCSLCDSDIEDCDCEAAGECLTCGTQCDDEGICPICAALERAQEERRTAKGAEALRAADRAVFAALSAAIESCRKCGAPMTLLDMVEGSGCTDQGEGEEAGRVFVYCSERCQETH